MLRVQQLTQDEERKEDELDWSALIATSAVDVSHLTHYGRRSVLAVIQHQVGP